MPHPNQPYKIRAMNHSDLVEKVAEATEMPEATANRAVEAVVQTIIDALKPATKFA
jgi:nucleoid DNA-binding protein